MPIREALLPLLAAVVCVGCSRVEEHDLDQQPAGTVFAALESRLLDAGVLLMRYRAEAMGAVEANIEGELEIRNGDTVVLSGSGSFGGVPLELYLAAADDTLRGGSGATSFEQATPADVKASLVLGLTRMGIMHNLARLSSGQPPDQADGGVAEWVRVVNLAWRPGERVPTLAFDIEVQEQPVAEATLALDGDGLPVRRVQQVRFPGGSMRVTEEYEILQLYP
jgi:hypothetical protein